MILFLLPLQKNKLSCNILKIEKITRMSSEKNRREEKTFFYTNTFQSKTEKTWEDFDQGNRKLTVQSPVKASKESQEVVSSALFLMTFR